MTIMRKLYGLLAIVGLAIGLAAPAQSAVLNMSGTLGITIGALPPVTIAQAPASVAIAVSTGGGSFIEPAGIFAATVTLPTQLFTGVSLISSLNITATNGTGTFTAIGGPLGGFGGVKPLLGTAVVGVLGGLINLGIPLAIVGAGGVIQGGAATLLVTVTGHIWTTGVASVTGVAVALTTAGTTTGFVNTASLAGYDNRSAGHQGTLLLVTPFRVLTNAAGNLPGFATQLLNFVPEPGTLLLIGSGIAGLAIVGRRKMRK
jgi:hypothetical protein